MSPKRAQQPLNDYQPMHPEFPDADIMALFEEKLDEDRDRWIVWFDGASNVLGHGWGSTAPITWPNMKHAL